MHKLRALSLLLLCATVSASLVLSNTPRSNQINQGTPEVIQRANLIQPQTQTIPPPRGTYHEIRSNLTIYITLGDTAPPQAVSELLVLAKDQVHDDAAHLGPTNTVPRRNNTDGLTQIIHTGLKYFIEPTRAFVHGRPPLEWGEFDSATSWLYEHHEVLLNHRQCTFVLFRKIGATTGNEVNLGFGGINGLNTTMTPASGTAKTPIELVLPSLVSIS